MVVMVTRIKPFVTAPLLYNVVAKHPLNDKWTCVIRIISSLAKKIDDTMMRAVSFYFVQGLL